MIDKITDSQNQYELWRQDDHGHKVLIKTFKSEKKAKIAMKIFENRSHKQIYWVVKKTA